MRQKKQEPAQAAKWRSGSRRTGPQPCGNKGTARQLKRRTATKSDDQGTEIEYYISEKKADSHQFERYFNQLNKTNGLHRE